MPAYAEWLLAYGVAVNLIAVVMTAVDKHRARRRQWRVAESTLLFVAALGGAPGMLVTMHVIRHKTRHRKFMWGLPAMLAVQVVLVWWLLTR